MVRSVRSYEAMLYKSVQTKIEYMNKGRIAKLMNENFKRSSLYFNLMKIK